MEPWYNMNRIEQIIGRAVRNCSHKQLTFSKRNVEIYLHCLSNKEREETADMYLYRKAEVKAVQIGVVSRTLKEVSADCLLNISQAGFTEAAMNQVVRLELSSRTPDGSALQIDYNVGDKPFSSTCDYMERCQYKCKSVDRGDTVMDTYNKNFMNQDTEHIKVSVREWMTQKFFYRKSQLVGMLRVSKSYPPSKIDAALNEMVDKQEPIVDKFGRLGTLIHAGDLYLFQPKVLDNMMISLYERTRPIEKKTRMITAMVPKSGILEGLLDNAGFKIFEQVKDKYNYVLNKNEGFDTNSVFQKKTYVLLKKAYGEMVTSGRDPSMMKNLLVARLLEEMSYDDTHALLSYFTKEQDSVGEKDENDVKRLCKEYYKSKTRKLISGSNTAYFLYDINKDDTYRAIKVDETAKDCVKVPELESKLGTKYFKTLVSKTIHFPYRFMGYVKPDDESNIVKVVKKLGFTGLKEMSPKRGDYELEFRYNDATEKNGKRWFLTLVEHGYLRQKIVKN